MAEEEKRRINTSIVIVFLILTLPLWLWIAWLWREKRPLNVAILDKTVLTNKGQEHISLDWILTQERYRKGNMDAYEPGRDYFGFFPLQDEKYLLKGLERFNDPQLDQLSTDADAVYVTDTYGIYRNEWYKTNDEKERSWKIYGGMGMEDMSFLKKMKDKHKLILTEFNCIGTPTGGQVQNEFRQAFGIRWSGWVGRYFDSFDTSVNQELPKWLIRQYKQQHNGQWPFHKSGIAYVHTDETVVVLENGTHLNTEFPYIISGDVAQNYYGLPDKLKYAYWFDIIEADTTRNHVLSTFQMEPNALGQAELSKHGIPVSFPAITTHNNVDYKFFYFSADFADNPIGLLTSYFRWVSYFKWLFYNTMEDPPERKSFFWKIYRPLMTRILNDYYSTLPKK